MMESNSNSGSLQSSSGGGGADAEHEYDSSTNLTQSQSQSQSQSISEAAAAANFLINNNNNPTTNNNNSFNHHLLQQQPSYNTTTFYNHHPPPTSWTQTIPTTFTHQNPTTTTTTTHQIGVAGIKNPKKRTRASRRAPTTVLTTDTTNFRQMVQEFTGIPTAPFTRRLFRPKVQSQSPFLNNNNNNNIVAESSTSIIHNNNNNNTTAAAASAYYHLSLSNFPKQPSTFLDLQQNPTVFSFQSLLQNSLPNQQPNKRWGEETNFEGVINQNIGGSKLNSALLEINGNAFSASGDQVQGNIEASWICPSN